MLKNFMTSLEIAREQINNSLFMFVNRTKSTYFTKDTAKMNFKDAIYFILKGLRKTLQIEIDDWFEYLGGENTMVLFKSQVFLHFIETFSRLFNH
ncbi:hypothetical protein [Pelosinus baikalensis]|uniref:Uncharacterized protein n=1 Tax=Pelosinus baikalensis TaxID=2892015 RepID=A0ABS8HZD6_9FIRM|nr:hypothetical protein [Pelosinus baikalensis]MCC5468530.1 hypothetical protein [Pelosinus baikalensis]